MASEARTTALALALALAGAACSKSEARTAAPAVDPRGCVAATIAHEEHTEAPDGVSHDVRYRERFVRCEGRVWTERLLPAGPAPVHAHAGRREMRPTYQLARLVTKQDDGRASLALVSVADKQIVEMSAESYDASHFDGDFDAASHLIPSRALEAMAVLGDRKAPPGAEWREKTSKTGYVRVLWSSRLDAPLEIESGSNDGKKRDRMRLELEPAPPAGELPWSALDTFERKSDSDFMD